MRASRAICRKREEGTPPAKRSACESTVVHVTLQRSMKVQVPLSAATRGLPKKKPLPSFLDGAIRSIVLVLSGLARVAGTVLRMRYCRVHFARRCGPTIQRFARRALLVAGLIGFYWSVTQPKLALWTRRMYFARVPRLAFTVGAVHAARRAAIS